ncbi:alpha/beta hydrolase [Candidatus Pelagibacter sp.]|nr:alpha/beta hydrolase [Candidatus Pelagibacter sp.]
MSKTKKIRYLCNYYKKNLYIVFLHGFMSDLEGEKPTVFLKYAKKNKLGFLAIEYSGHGKSSGEFIKGNISKWTSETKIIIKNIIKKNDFILIGSSMGSWISLNQFRYFKKQIKGFLGIGSAPEFLEKIMWKKFTKKMKTETMKKGIYNLKHGGYEYPITYQLIKDGKKNKILHKKIDLQIPEVERLLGLVFLQLKSQEENLLQLFMAHIILITKLKNSITQLWLGQT